MIIRSEYKKILYLSLLYLCHGKKSGRKRFGNLISFTKIKNDLHPVSIRKTFLLVKLLSKKLDRISLDSFPGAAESIEISQPN